MWNVLVAIRTMPMTPSGPAKTRRPGEYHETLTCRGLPLCARGKAQRAAEQAAGCAMCVRSYQYYEAER